MNKNKLMISELRKALNAFPSMKRASCFDVIASIDNACELARKLNSYADKLESDKAIALSILGKLYRKAKRNKVKLSKVLNKQIQKRLNASDRGTWTYYLRKLANWIENDMQGKLPHMVFNLSGNTKLDFAAFSSLPFVDCPGKGECQKWCYSLKAWRYPASFCRQIQNSLLIRNQFSVIENEYKSLPEKITVRLYVDGDFPSVEILKAWMELIKERPDLKPYGYSKSWIEFLKLDSTGYAWPDNYTLNISGGSKFADNSGIKNAMTKLHVTRGGYDAVGVDQKYIDNGAYHSKDHPDSFEYRAQVRKELKKLSKKVFACPGTCSNCMPNGEHACGSKKMKGVLIGIGIHSIVA